LKGVFRQVRHVSEWRCFAAANSRMALPAIMAVLLFGAGSRARASSLVIQPTFDSSITNLSDAAAIEGAINAGIQEIEGAITSPNNITVTIDFQNASTGLGESITTVEDETYFDYYNAYKAVATSATQLTALSSLTNPTSESSGNPVNGSMYMQLTSAEGRNLGFSAPAGVSVAGSGTFDSEILLNTSITSPPNGLSGYYSLEAVAMHEIDEALGIGGPGSTIGDSTIAVGDLDLFRYTGKGVRSYSTTQTTSPYSYFSIDGGNTVLTYFNQTSGADYADWLSNPIPNGYGVQVQDAYGLGGTNPSLGVNEVTAFNVIGYQQVTPEPSTFLLAGSLLGMLAVGRRRIMNGRR